MNLLIFTLIVLFFHAGFTLAGLIKFLFITRVHEDRTFYLWIFGINLLIGVALWLGIMTFQSMLVHLAVFLTGIYAFYQLGRNSIANQIFDHFENRPSAYQNLRLVLRAYAVLSFIGLILMELNTI